MTTVDYDQLVDQDKERYVLFDKCLSKNLHFNDHTFNLDDDVTGATGTLRTDDSANGSDCESDFRSSKKRGQHIIHINARSLRNKLTDMRILQSINQSIKKFIPQITIKYNIFTPSRE